MQRRHFLQSAAIAGSAAVLPSQAAADDYALGKAKHVIMIWLGGGMAQIDTFDPKAVGDAKSRKAGSYYPAIDTAVPGVQVCQHLPGMARRMERITAMRTVFHNVVDEHAAATNRMHTGRPTSGTVQYPSLGSIVAHQLRDPDQDVPAYVLIGYPSPARGPGFLGQSAGFVYLTDPERGPAGLARPNFITEQRQQRRVGLLNTVREEGRRRFAGDRVFQEYDQAIEESLRLSGPDFMQLFDPAAEDPAVRARYGGGFGDRCLLARKLVQAGTQFVEVSHNMNFRNGTGWDTHNDGQLNQHLLIEEMDTAVSALMDDLDSRGLLDETLIVINTEFGRPAQFDSGGGRGHHSECFTAVLAGGGLNHRGAYGVSDELAMKPLENAVSVPDLFATILACTGIAPTTILMDETRPVPVTDNGRPVSALLG